MKIKVKGKTYSTEDLISVEDYAGRTNQTRANVHYHIKNNPESLNFVKIVNTYYIVWEK